MDLFANHGTKIIGLLITIAGLVQTIAPTFLGKWGAAASLVAGGILTVLRGFQNSATQATAQVQQKPK